MFIPKSIVCLRDYSARQFRSDLSAGVVVGLVALPLAMAFSIASGLGPERGIYTAVIAGFLVSALGGSRVQIGGPTGAFVVIVGGIVAQFGYQGLVAATLMAGVMLILMGLFRMGSMVKFIPYPVTTGFTSGIAVIIFSGQMKDFFGLQMGAVPLEFVAKWEAYFHAFPTLNPWSAGLALFTILCITFWPKSWHKVPGPIAALVLVTAAASLFNLPVETIQSRFGGVPQGLPAPALPDLSLSELRQLLPSAFTIAFLAAVESLLSAVVADGMIGGKHKSNLELIAQGVANLASPLFGGIPATGALARTATNVKNGGRTPVAGMVHAAVLLVILMAAGTLAAKIPLACLAGILVVVSYHMSEWRSMRALMSAPRSDIAVLLTTFLLTIFVDLTVAVEVGMVLASFLFMRKITGLTQVRVLSSDLDEPGSEEGSAPPSESGRAIPKGVEVYTIQGTFSFGAANRLFDLDRITSKPPKVLILDLEGVLYMDATGTHVLDQLHRNCAKSGIRLMFAGMHEQPMSVLEGSGRMGSYGRDNFRKGVDACLAELSRSGGRE